MTKFSYIHRKSQELYKKTASAVQRHKALLEQGKYLFLSIWFFANIVLYAAYVNLTSTQGYFLSQAEKKREDMEFQYNIVKLNMTEYNRILRGMLQRGDAVKKIEITSDIVQIPIQKQQTEVTGDIQTL